MSFSFKVWWYLINRAYKIAISRIQAALIPTYLPIELKINHENFHNGFWKIPEYATIGSAGFDLLAAIDTPLTIEPFETHIISSGLSIWIKDPNFVLLIHPRSGVGCKRGLILGNTIPVIDSDYQGELKLCLTNRTLNPITVNPGEYIAQGLIILKVEAIFNVVSEFSNSTTRGDKGFGHSK